MILGINGGDKREDQRDVTNIYHHDAAAALLVNGRLVAAVEEERLNRIKHSNCFPALAIDYCLRNVGAKVNSLDKIVVNSAAQFVERELSHSPQYKKSGWSASRHQFQSHHHFGRRH